MPLSNNEALRLSNDELYRALVESEPRQMEILEVMPFFETDGDRLTIPRSPSRTSAPLSSIREAARSRTRLRRRRTRTSSSGSS